MTDLLTRIRAHVAEMPTHHCFQCSEDIAQVDGGCPNCGENWIPQKLTESHAIALLREVAALEPIHFIQGLVPMDAGWFEVSASAHKT